MKISDEQLALMKGHTPWPWRAGRPGMLSTALITGKFIYAGQKGEQTQYVAVAVNEDVPDEQIMPNAHLIAAAPALLSEVLELRAEVTKLRALKIEETIDAVNRLHEENMKLRADAERYRAYRKIKQEDTSDAEFDDEFDTAIEWNTDAERGAT